jgi:hypothetical protein
MVNDVSNITATWNFKETPEEKHPATFTIDFEKGFIIFDHPFPGTEIDIEYNATATLTVLSKSRVHSLSVRKNTDNIIPNTKAAKRQKTKRVNHSDKKKMSPGDLLLGVLGRSNQKVAK